jgi:hypothetical protein
MKTESLSDGKGCVFYASPGAAGYPKLGDLMTVRFTKCRIVKVHPLGALDLVSLCGNYAFRVSGLPFA